MLPPPCNEKTAQDGNGQLMTMMTIVRMVMVSSAKKRVGRDENRCLSAEEAVSMENTPCTNILPKAQIFRSKLFLIKIGSVFFDQPSRLDLMELWMEV